MELRHLRYFVAVAEELNIGRAAERLHMSQPPLTRQISQLEREVGTPLFVRTNRGVELTNAGEVLLVDARRMLELAEQAHDRARRAGDGGVGRLDVALFGTGIFGKIPVLLRAFRHDAPDVRIVLHNMTKEEQLEALAQRRIDLAFNRIVQPVPGITSEVLLRERLYVAAPEDHPRAARTAIRLAELRGEPLVLFPTGARPSFIDVVLGMCRDAGFEPDVVAEVDDVVHGIALVASGGALCLVPDSGRNLRVPGIVYRRLTESSVTHVELCCVYRADDRSPVLARLLQSFRATVASTERRRGQGRGA
jgi:DNA-binding transcriptional LysR family regulator